MNEVAWRVAGKRGSETDVPRWFLVREVWDMFLYKNPRRVGVAQGSSSYC